jgi:hypothetical protein
MNGEMTGYETPIPAIPARDVTRPIQGDNEKDRGMRGEGSIMTTYSCSLHFGTLELEGIEANNEREAREIAMKAFNPVLQSIDEKSIRIAIMEKKTKPIIVYRPTGFESMKRKPSPRTFQERVCKEIARMAEMEIRV